MASEQDEDRSKKNIKKKPRGNLSKADISQPSGVKHFYHLGPKDAHQVQDDLDDMQLPTACPVEETGIDQLVITKDDLKHLIRSELEPIKKCLDHLESDMSGVLSDRQNTESTDLVRSTCIPFRSEGQDDVEQTSGYENVLFSQQSPDTSETNLKKPMPSPRPDMPAQHPKIKRNTGSRITLKKNRPLSNPSHEAFEDGTIIPARVESLEDNCIHSPVPNDTIGRKRPVPEPRRNTLPKNRTSQISRTPSAPMVKNAQTNIQVDERECLAAALQSNIQDIVDNLIFTESELPDELAVDSCITDEENSDIRKLPNRRDQIRVLICLIKGRDKLVLQKFLKRIEKTNKSVADKVKATLEENKTNGLTRRFVCAWCELQNNVNIKYVVDGLWQMYAIHDALYMDVARCELSTGNQRILWKRLSESLDGISNKESKKSAYEQLVCTLTAKNHYRYIAKNVEASLRRHGHLKCECKVHFCPNFNGSFTEVSSCTPYSSTSDVRFTHDKSSDSDKLSACEGVKGEACSIRM